MRTKNKRLPHQVNRPLEAKEYHNQLHQQQSTDIPPFHAASIIKMNSTYLEITNELYSLKGSLVASSLFYILPIAIYIGIIMPIYSVLTYEGYVDPVGRVLAFGISSLAFILFFLLAYFLIKKDINYTHLPIRFNRQNRMIYVFDSAGQEFSAAWDKIHFNYLSAKSYWGTIWAVGGHVLSEDSQLVVKSFFLGGRSHNKDFTLAHWEFIRQYMEQGPEQLYYNPQQQYRLEQLKTRLIFCNDIDGKKESKAFSKYLVLFNFTYKNRWFEKIIFFPGIYARIYGRYIAMKYSKLPQWSAEVEQACPIAANDPYINNATTNADQATIAKVNALIDYG